MESIYRLNEQIPPSEGVCSLPDPRISLIVEDFWRKSKHRSYPNLLKVNPSYREAFLRMNAEIEFLGAEVAWDPKVEDFQWWSVDSASRKVPE